MRPDFRCNPGCTYGAGSNEPCGLRDMQQQQVLLLVMGEITTNAYVDIQKIVRDTVSEIGYTRGKYGFDADTCGVITAIDEQSADIALGVDKASGSKRE